MCLVAFAWKVHPDFPLLISANRDEFFDRPTAPLHQWPEDFYAGKDLKAGGTWMGFHPNGRWALLTNFRDFSQRRTARHSRGKLVSDYLSSLISIEDYLDQIWNTRSEFEGFNLLVGEGNRLMYLSNYGDGPQEIKPGIHGLSNGLINADWPKITLAKTQLQNQLSNPNLKDLLGILKSQEKYPLELLPKTGVPPEKERELSAQLIRMAPNYGTVSSAAVIQDQAGKTFIRERRFKWDSGIFEDTQVQFNSLIDGKSNV